MQLRGEREEVEHQMESKGCYSKQLEYVHLKFTNGHPLALIQLEEENDGVEQQEGDEAPGKRQPLSQISGTIYSDVRFDELVGYSLYMTRSSASFRFDAAWTLKKSSLTHPEGALPITNTNGYLRPCKCAYLSLL